MVDYRDSNGLIKTKAIKAMLGVQTEISTLGQRCEKNGRLDQPVPSQVYQTSSQ